MKRRNRFYLNCIPAFIAFALCAAVPAGLPAAYAADPQEAVQLPEWIPDTYGDALHFVNTYGGTHIEDGLLCVVLCENENRAPDSASPQYDLTVSGSAMQEISHQLYAAPDNGSFYVMNLDVIVYQPVSAGDFQVALSCPDAELLTDFERDPYIPDYQFSVDDHLVITETDPYGWAPDCITEFEAFRSRHGAFAANGNQIAACLNPSLTVTETYAETISSDAVRRIGMWGCSERTPALSMYAGPAWHTKWQVVLYEAVSDGIAEITWQTEELGDTAQNYGQLVDRSQRIKGSFLIMDDAKTVLETEDARITLVDAQTGAPVTVTPNSGFALYQIVNSPNAKPLLARLTSNPAIVRDLGDQIDHEHLSLDNAAFGLALPDGYEIAEDGGTITELENGSFEILFRLNCNSAGDINRDAVFNQADAEALLRWLHADPELQIADWDAADRRKDRKLDAADLTLVKRALLNTETADPITAATRMPGIVDETGTVTDSMKEKLEAAVLAAYPGSDLSAFRLVYAPDHPQAARVGGTFFYVYFKDTLVHGLGDLDLISNVYARVSEEGKAEVHLLAPPEDYQTLDLNSEDLSEAMMQNRFKGDAVDRIIYVQRNSNQKPVQVAYRVISTVFQTETIYDEKGVRLVSIQLPAS